MHYRSYIYTAILAITLFSSCVMTKKVNYLQTRDNIPEYADTLQFTDYRLQLGDFLYIKVLSLDEEMAEIFNGTQNNNMTSLMASDNATARLYMYLIEEDGCINYPYIGRIEAAGKTQREVKEEIEDKMKNYLQIYSVDVRLANRSFSIIGESGSGRYNIPRQKINIFEALAMSGDLSLYAKRDKIQLIRQTQEGTVVKTFDLRSESIIDSEYYYIQPNDVIYIPFDDAKYWGAKNFSNVLSMTISTVSFGLLIYSIVNKFAIKK